MHTLLACLTLRVQLLSVCWHIYKIAQFAFVAKFVKFGQFAVYMCVCLCVFMFSCSVGSQLRLALLLATHFP